jgi:hypothetical protein
MCLLLAHHILINLEVLTPWKTVSFEKLTVAERNNFLLF